MMTKRAGCFAQVAGAVLLLTACATSPNAIRESYDPFDTMDVGGDVQSVAQCAKSVLANDPPNTLNPPRPMIVDSDSGISLLGNARDGTVYVVDFDAEDGVATTYVSYAYAMANRNGEIVMAALSECATA